MFLSEILQQLEHGEFRSLGISQKGAGIEKIDYPKILSSINLGLTSLHTRFPLREAEAVLQMYDEIDTYYLDSKYAITNTGSTEPIKYLIDSIEDPFKDNVLVIERVRNSCGDLLYTNDSEQCDSVFTPTYNSVQVPCEVKDGIEALGVVFRADHPRLEVSTTIDPETTQISLSHGYLRALLLFVAARYHTGTTQLDGANIGDTFWAKYEAECARIEQYGLVIKDSTTNTKLEKNGWV